MAQTILNHFRNNPSVSANAVFTALVDNGYDNPADYRELSADIKARNNLTGRETAFVAILDSIVANHG